MAENAYPKNVTDLHIELTDKCQASCPMCARNMNGGTEKNFVGKNEISLDLFTKWFPEDFLANLTNFYACGNYGDPIIAKDCLEIFKYVRDVNKKCRLAIHTNGSAKSSAWWEELAHALGNYHTVTFGIDGFSESHALYRRGTDWQRIISNAKKFISAGGNAEIDSLVFKHNQHDVAEFEKQMILLGFSKVNFKYTRRFYDMKIFPVQDKNGKYEYNLEPTSKENTLHFLPLDSISKDISIWEDTVKHSSIQPKCIEKNEIYVDARGNVFPCCWIGSDWIEEPITENSALKKLRNLLVENTKSVFLQLKIPNLKETRIQDIDWENFEEILNIDKPWTCVKNCNG